MEKEVPKTHYILHRMNKDGEFGEYLNYVSELGIKEFNLGVNVDLDSDVTEMFVTGSKGFTSIEYNETLDPKRNGYLSVKYSDGLSKDSYKPVYHPIMDRTFPMFRDYESAWDENPKSGLIRDYMEHVKGEILDGMPYGVDVKMSLNPGILKSYMVTQDTSRKVKI